MPLSRGLPWPLDRAVGPLRKRLRARRRTAFIFSGGGSLGAVQVGMLRALVEAGVQPDVIIGCSAGAINGAGFAAEPSLRGVARLERIWRKLAVGNPDLMPGGFMPVAVQLARKGLSLHDPALLETMLSEELPAATFGDLRVPFHCVATDLHAAEEFWFTEGPIVPALMASASLPAVYPSREHEGRTLIDGGVLNEVHTDRAAEWGATELYVLHVGHLDERLPDVQRPFDSAMRAYWTARRFRLEENLRRVPSNCTVHRLPSGPTPRLRFDDFTQGPDLAEIAYNLTADYLQTGRLPAPEPVDHDWPITGGDASGANEQAPGDGPGEPATAGDRARDAAEPATVDTSQGDGSAPDPVDDDTDRGDDAIASTP